MQRRSKLVPKMGSKPLLAREDLTVQVFRSRFGEAPALKRYEQRRVTEA